MISPRYRPRYNQRRTGIVNQNRIHLIHHRVMMLALHQVIDRMGHIIPQIIETKFIVGSVGDIGPVSLPTGLRIGSMTVNAINPQSMKLKDRAVPFRVTTSQIIVDCNNMHTQSGQRVEVGWQGGYQGFAFPCRHLRNFATVQDHPSQQLHIVMNHVPDHLGPGGRPTVFVNRFGAFNPNKILGLSSQIPVVSRCRHAQFLVLAETTRRFFDHRKGLG